MAINLKGEAEVKEFLDNLGIEYRFGCYHEKKYDVCHLLGDYLEAIKKDFEKASKVYKTNCDEQKYAKSCYKYATYSYLGKGKVPKDQKTAFNYYNRGCEYGDTDSCLYAGLMCISSAAKSAKERDFPLGLKLLQKACSGGSAFGCHYISGMYLVGVQSPSQAEDLPKDMKKAHYYASEACKLGNPHACVNLSLMYKNGDGVDKDEAKAEQFKKIAVELHEEAAKHQRQLTFQEGIPGIPNAKGTESSPT
ncbi:cytochrome c oxidase assembly factor 7 homolog [Ischnura elegans]|uniref:cytochrome c oxidase assembly factor 7 homolog n=1 Tax=Ischnura elegans TaxID=197161 RepID=UPI001ED86782|nr:cytochrome c oxidase assembly factor 7 homolog [Ischnura elegans]